MCPSYISHIAGDIHTVPDNMYNIASSEAGAVTGHLQTGFRGGHAHLGSGLAAGPPVDSRFCVFITSFHPSRPTDGGMDGDRGEIMQLGHGAGSA